MKDSNFIFAEAPQNLSSSSLVKGLGDIDRVFLGFLHLKMLFTGRGGTRGRIYLRRVLEDKIDFKEGAIFRTFLEVHRVSASHGE